MANYAVDLISDGALPLRGERVLNPYQGLKQIRLDLLA